MRARIFDRRADADAEQRAQDAAAGLPRVLREGEYAIALPGNAAARIRARGVQVSHVAEVLANAAGTQFAVASNAPDAIEVDPVTWRALGIGAGVARD